jgi:NTE family protein
MALHAISLLTHRRLVDDIERHRADAHLIVLPPPCPLNIQPIDFGHADELIDLALRDARGFLDSGGETRPAIHTHMHRHVKKAATHAVGIGGRPEAVSGPRSAPGKKSGAGGANRS